MLPMLALLVVAMLDVEGFLRVIANHHWHSDASKQPSLLAAFWSRGLRYETRVRHRG
jgi:hypothetical protein